MTTTDAAGYVLPPVSKRKKSFFEEEEIEVKPSTELIPDEYEHAPNKSVSFHIFRISQEEDMANQLVERVTAIGYSVENVKNVHEMDNNKQFNEDLNAIRGDAANKSALLLIFIGYYGEQDGTLMMMNETETHKTVHVKDIWNKFSSNQCPELKSKPKIFIFCTSQKPPTVQTDSRKHRGLPFDKIYDFPAEADMLIVYKKVEDPFSRHNEHFLNKFSENIGTFSKKYDIIDLVSYINYDDENCYPLIISTLTRKFYLTPSTEREHFLSVTENQRSLEETLRKIHRDVERLHAAQKKKKEKELGPLNSKKKSEAKPTIAKKKEKAPIADSKSKQVAFASPGGQNKLNAGSVPGAKRLRQASETDSGSKGKLPWRN